MAIWENMKVRLEVPVLTERLGEHVGQARSTSLA